MGIFEKVVCFISYVSLAFILITSMEDLGICIGFEQMGDLGVAIIFGAMYMHLAVLDNDKKDKEEKKDRVN